MTCEINPQTVNAKGTCGGNPKVGVAAKPWE